MPVPTLITELSTTAASNFPAGSDSPANLDDVQRAHASFIAQLRDGKDASGGYAGLTLFKLNLINALGTVTSWFTTAATAARTWTMPDKDGTVAMTSDITGGTQAGSFTTLSATGTLGVRVTPGAWASAQSVVELVRGSISSGPSGAVNHIAVAANAYSSGSNDPGLATWSYTYTGQAHLYQQYSSTHTWYSASSGTAGNPITFTQVLSTGKGLTVALEGASAVSGAGITFPSTQVPSANANTLDDYEEGTWTPTVVGTTEAGTGTYSVRVGEYTKVGRLVTFRLHVALTAHTGTGFMRINGLPFASALQEAFAIYTNDLTLSSNNTASALVAPGGSQVFINQQPVGGGVPNNVTLDPACTIFVSGTYAV